MSSMPRKSNTAEVEVSYPVRFYYMAPGDAAIRRRYPKTYLVYGADLKGNRFSDHCLGYVYRKGSIWEAHAVKKDGGFSERNISTILNLGGGTDPRYALDRNEAATHLFLHLRRFEFGKRLLLAAGVL